MPLHSGEARAALARAGARLAHGRPRGGRAAPAAWRRSPARPPSTWPATAPGCTSSCASCAPPGRAGVADGRRDIAHAGVVLERKAARPPPAPSAARRRRSWSACALALAAHDPERTLERGYALVETPAASW